MKPALPAVRILVADDDGDVLHALQLLLKGEGYEVVTVPSPSGVLDAVREQDFDAILLDLNYTRDTTSGREGLDLLAKLQELDSTLPILVMTAWASVETAVEAMRRGARDYVQKPWDNSRLLATVRSQIELGQALRAGLRLADENRRLREQQPDTFIAESTVMQPVLEIMRRVAPSDANILITGEHGTGKEVVARWLHSSSPRSAKPLVAVDAGSITEGLFESELFGHVRGAFTDAKLDRAGCFELADGGTLFLDEIANVPHKQQAKFLRVLETGQLQRVGSSKIRQVDARVISATNANIAEEVADGRFREDLLYRLNTVEIALPPLRERREDIPIMADHFLRRLLEKYRKPLAGFDEEAMEMLREYAWPGNVRELEHVTERAVLMAPGERITVADLGLGARPESGLSLEAMTLEDAERHLIQKALDRYGGNVSQAAEALGLSRGALYRRLQRHEL